MHKVSSKMIEPDVLTQIQKATSNCQGKCCLVGMKAVEVLFYSISSYLLTARIHTDEDPEIEVALKHKVLQDIIVNSVYLGGSPSIVEEAGFGSGSVAYAKAQCAMSEHEGDPLIGQYASSAMVKIWDAAGLDITSIERHGV